MYYQSPESIVAFQGDLCWQPTHGRKLSAMGYYLFSHFMADALPALTFPPRQPSPISVNLRPSAVEDFFFASIRGSFCALCAFSQRSDHSSSVICVHLRIRGSDSCAFAVEILLRGQFCRSAFAGSIPVARRAGR